ncbi:carbohydrate ABC transporter permease [Cohnella sp. WQ 127256]|uniref:carbohydrate ABC transporter permease n=1 Tax=Cohnella sp. WQ 127256 TaxID=2938790 RepID=UPI0021196715|nr:sugar ABC transporter permease [Cohnella sp. WQ 127256]
MLKKQYYSYWLLFPGMLIFFAFFVVPSLMGFYFAFTDLDASFKVSRFVGFDNFVTLYENPSNLLAFKNTLIFAVVTTVFKISLGLLLAILANQQLKSRLVLRSVLFFPVILSTIAVAIAFKAIFHPSTGILNVFLSWIGLDSLAMSWLTDPDLVMYSVSFVEVWKWTGFSMMLFLAALQSMPQEVTEAAKIDGASPSQHFRYITLPMLTPVLNTNVILSVIGGLKVFDLVYALTGGGPGYASNVINTAVFKAFAAGRNGEATAANLVLFIVILITVLCLNNVINREAKR